MNAVYKIFDFGLIKSLELWLLLQEQEQKVSNSSRWSG